jgi:hypothetical protein
MLIVPNHYEEILMKTLFAVIFFFCMTTIALAAEPASTVYDGTVLTEDATWRGTILVRGFVVVSPQATLRIDPGTVVRFAAAAGQQLPNLVVQGRLHIAGTAEKPVVLTSERSGPDRGTWGGVVLLSTEKRNLMEHCRIEYVETGIDVRFSTIVLKSVSITQARTALQSHDGNVQMANSTFSDSETGLEVYNSEVDGRDSTISACKRGGVLVKSALVLAATKIVNNLQTGLDMDECRYRISGGDFSDNGLGLRIKGGEGQLGSSRFQRNGGTALHLLGSRVKVQRCLFTDNKQDGLRVEDGRALFINNAFSANGGFNLNNVGHESVSARQNWWGTTDRSLIEEKINDAARDKNSGAVHVFPWLDEKPPLMP